MNMNENKGKDSNESNTSLSRIGNDSKKKIANIKVISNNSHKAWWV